MLDLNEIENRLWNLTVSDIDKMCILLHIGRSGIKQDKIRKIIDVYREKEWTAKTYNSLNAYEKELADNLIKYDFNPTYDSVKKIKDKYQDSKLPSDKYNSFFINEDVPMTIKKELVKIAPPPKTKFEKVKEKIDPEDSYGYIIGRENRVEDFDELIRYAISNRVKPTDSNRYFPKRDLIKYHNINNYMDIIRNGNMLFDDIKSIKDTIVSFGIINLLEASGVLSLNHEYTEPSYNYKKFIKMNKIEKFSCLLESYLSSDTAYINETKRIQRAKLKLIEYPNLQKSRQFILNMIKLLPLDYSWISGKDFREEIRMKNYNFLRNYTGEILAKDNYSWYDDYYEEAQFEDCEYGFIDICLMEYFATIGIVDVIVDYTEEKYTYQRFLEVKYLRLTSLGAVLLGLKESVETIDKDSNFIVTDDFKIIIPGGKNKLEYELFFERFLTKKEEEKDKTIYLIDFLGIAKANDLGIKIFDIVDYIEKNASEYSKKAIDKIKSWEENIGKIIIKNVDIIEYPKELETLLKGDKKISKLLNNNEKNISIINKKNINEIKKNIEKLELFCELDDTENK